MQQQHAQEAHVKYKDKEGRNPLFSFKPLDKEFLIKRGYCCGNKCQNCPYFPRWEKGSTQLT